MIGQSKTGFSSQIIFITLFSSRCTVLLRLLQQIDRIYRRKTNFLSFVDFSSSDFNVQGHIVSTDEDALRTQSIYWPCQGKDIVF